MKNILMLIFILSSISLNAQIYFSDHRNRVGILNFEDCELEFMTGQFGGISIFEHTFTDIALHPNGKLYGTAFYSQEERMLVEIGFNETRTLDTLCIIPEEHCTSLVCTPSGRFYLGYRHLFSYTLESNVLTDFGVLPAGDQLRGDLIYEDDKLIGSTVNFFTNKSKLYHFNLDQLYNSQVLIEYEGSPGAWGALTEYWDTDCQKKYLLGSRFTVEKNSLDLVDLDSLTEEPFVYCDSVLSNRGSHIFGLSSTDEFRTTCDLQLDLDIDDSSGRLIDHYEVDSLCQVSLNITDEDVGIKNLHDQIDSMVIVLASGEQHPGEEILEGTFSAVFEIRGQATRHLTVINTGTATDEDFITALKSVRFKIIAPDITNGERVLHTFLYSGSSTSDAAKTFIQIDVNHQPNAGLDGTAMVCEGRSVNLFNALGGDPETNGHWAPTLWSGSNTYVSIYDEPGTYQYITNSGGCAADTALVQVIEHYDPYIGFDSTQLTILALCAGDTLVWDATLPNAQNYFWNDDFEDSIRYITAEGIYSVEVFDANHCYWFAKTYVQLTEEMPMTEEAISLCQGEIFAWNGIFVQSDTTICQNFERGYACDSTHCISFEFAPSPVITQTIALCEGDIWEWQEQSISQDTLLCQTFQTSSGCDSTVCFDVRFALTYNILDSYVFTCGETPYEALGVTFTQDTTFCFSYLNTQGCDSIRCIEIQIIAAPAQKDSLSICEGDIYLFGAQLLNETGDYEATFLDEFGCDSLVQFHLDVFPTYEQHLDTVLAAGEQLEIGGQIFVETGLYEIPLRTEFGCDSTIFLNLEVISSVLEVSSNSPYIIPTLITPETHERNKNFSIYTKDGSREIFPMVTIYDVWGRVVFSVKDLSSGNTPQAWDGTSQGNLLPKGVYFYKIITTNGQPLTGSLILM